MYKLYARAGSGSAIVEVLLEETKLDYEVEEVPRRTDSRFREGFYQINPLGQVPALVFPDGTLMTESAAITLYLADLDPQLRLAPRHDSPKRPAYLRWMIYLAANVYMTDLRAYYPSRYSADPGHAGDVKAAALAQMAREWEIFAAALGSGPYILGAELCAVDIYAAMLATWNCDVPAFFRKHPNVKALYDKVTARPSVAKVWTRNRMEDWAPQAASA